MFNVIIVEVKLAVYYNLDLLLECSLYPIQAYIKELNYPVLLSLKSSNSYTV